MLKKVCIPLTRAQPQGQVKRELSHYLPTEPAQPGREGGSGTLGLQGGVLSGLSRGCSFVVPEPRPQSRAGEEVDRGGR